MACGGGGDCYVVPFQRRHLAETDRVLLEVLVRPLEKMLLNCAASEQNLSRRHSQETPEEGRISSCG